MSEPTTVRINLAELIAAQRRGDKAGRVKTGWMGVLGQPIMPAPIQINGQCFEVAARRMDRGERLDLEVDQAEGRNLIEQMDTIIAITAEHLEQMVAVRQRAEPLEIDMSGNGSAGTTGGSASA